MLLTRVGGGGAEATGVGVCREGAERDELAEAVEPRDEQSGVDRAGNVGRRVDGGDHGHVEHIGYVAGGQAALGFGDQDDPIRSIVRGGQEGCEGDVAGAAQDDVVLVGWWRLRGGAGRSGVDDERLGRRLVKRGGVRREHEVLGDLNRLVGDRQDGTDERRG